MLDGRYLISVTLLREKVPAGSGYPFSIPAVSKLESLELHPQVTFLVGENGSGKSTWHAAADRSSSSRRTRPSSWPTRTRRSST